LDTDYDPAPGVMFRSLRSTDDDDTFFLRMTGPRFELRRKSEGKPAGTILWTNNDLGSSLDTTRQMEIILLGNTIKVYADDTLLFDITDTVLSTGVYHGISVEQGTGGWVDNFGVFFCDARWLDVEPTQDANFVEIDP
jgi:hypothetical protein